MEKVPKPKKGDDSTLDSSLVNGHISNPTRTQVEIETQTSLMSPQKREYYSNEGLIGYRTFCIFYGLGSKCVHGLPHSK